MKNKYLKFRYIVWIVNFQFVCPTVLVKYCGTVYRQTKLYQQYMLLSSVRQKNKKQKNRQTEDFKLSDQMSNTSFSITSNLLQMSQNRTGKY